MLKRHFSLINILYAKKNNFLIFPEVNLVTNKTRVNLVINEKIRFIAILISNLHAYRRSQVKLFFLTTQEFFFSLQFILLGVGKIVQCIKRKTYLHISCYPLYSVIPLILAVQKTCKYFSHTLLF